MFRQKVLLISFSMTDAMLTWYCLIREELLFSWKITLLEIIHEIKSHEFHVSSHVLLYEKFEYTFLEWKVSMKVKSRLIWLGSQQLNTEKKLSRKDDHLFIPLLYIHEFIIFVTWDIHWSSLFERQTAVNVIITIYSLKHVIKSYLSLSV